MAGDGRAMSGQIPRPIGIALVSMLLISGITVGTPANNARAVDCLAAPTSAAPKNSEWHYRTDRAKQRKCWYLRAAQTAVVPAESLQTPPADSQPATFKNSTDNHGGITLSEKEREKLFTKFLEWSRHTAD
jgi:hypothetical protein